MGRRRALHGFRQRSPAPGDRLAPRLRMPVTREEVTHGPAKTAGRLSGRLAFGARSDHVDRRADQSAASRAETPARLDPPTTGDRQSQLGGRQPAGRARNCRCRSRSPRWPRRGHRPRATTRTRRRPGPGRDPDPCRSRGCARPLRRLREGPRHAHLQHQRGPGIHGQQKTGQDMGGVGLVAPADREHGTDGAVGLAAVAGSRRTPAAAPFAAPRRCRRLCAWWPGRAVSASWNARSTGSASASVAVSRTSRQPRVASRSRLAACQLHQAPSRSRRSGSSSSR